MCRRAETRLSVVAVCLVSALAWALFALPASITANGKPPGGGGGNGQFNTQGYWVWISQDPLAAYEPEGPAPEGSADNGTAGGSVDVVAGGVRAPDNPEMFIHGNATCLDSFPTGPLFDPWALLDDDDFVPMANGEEISNEVFVGCFPEVSSTPMWINGDATTTTVRKRLLGLSLNGKKNLDYWLTIEVIPGGGWDPLGIAPGDSVTLYLGAWSLTTVNPKQASSGCSATGDFSDDVDPVTGAVGTAITVSRWTLDEQAAHDACE